MTAVNTPVRDTVLFDVRTTPMMAGPAVALQQAAVETKYVQLQSG
ncbi:hypothetical protein [Mycolicibacterium sp.]